MNPERDESIIEGARGGGEVSKGFGGETNTNPSADLMFFFRAKNSDLRRSNVDSTFVPPLAPSATRSFGVTGRVEDEGDGDDGDDGCEGSEGEGMESS